MENSSFSDTILNQILKKKEINFSEEKYKYWIRHSLAFLSKRCSSRATTESWTQSLKLKVLDSKSWTQSVEKLLEKAWYHHFEEEDKTAMAYMGKLGSKEGQKRIKLKFGYRFNFLW